MPELPDIEIFTNNLNRLFKGRKLEKIKILRPEKLKDGAAQFSKSLKGKTLIEVYRSGKEMRFKFSNNTLLGLHLMLTGDVFVFEKKNEHKFTIAELYFSGNKALALTDRMRNARITLNPEDKSGVDALSKELNAAYLKKALKRRTQIKSLLANQDVIRGIGGSYADEILWEARISPYSIAAAIPDEKIKELVKTIKRVLRRAIKLITKHHGDKINTEAKEFLRIHTRLKKSSPTGKPIIIDKKGMTSTFYTSEQVLYQ